MLFRKYHIVFFRDNHGGTRKIQIRGWMFLIPPLLVTVLAAGNAYLWGYYRDHLVTERRLELSEKSTQEQKTQILSLSRKIKNLEKDITRVRDFDAKLRMMLNPDHTNVQKVGPVGGVSGADFSNDYLPLYRQELLARKMHEFLRQLNMDVRLEEVRQQEILHQLRSNRNLLAATPSIWPTEGYITSRFGWRTNPFTGKREFHKGLDIAGPVGTPIVSPARGRIISSGRDGSYGLSIKIDHGSGLVTRYAHLHKSLVKVGQVIDRGDAIASLGNSGRSTGPHLHYEIQLGGVPVDPMRYIIE
ncbi:MAG: M23 family metallopeptidase [Desulfovibrionaceae bacterium]